MMRNLDHVLYWSGALWVLWGITGGIGMWFDISVQKTDKAGAVVYYVFMGLWLLGRLILDCTKAVLAAIRESSTLGK